ncbi:Uncharacterised protein [uncultured archaeon]|nr:Uncharacterised protein [uncultured archaeon]
MADNHSDSEIEDDEIEDVDGDEVVADNDQPEQPAPNTKYNTAFETPEHPEDNNLIQFIIITKNDKKYSCPEKLIKQSKVIQSHINSLKVDTLKSSEITSGDLFYITSMLSKDKLTIDDLPNNMDCVLRMVQVSYLLGLNELHDTLCQFTAYYIDFKCNSLYTNVKQLVGV